MRTIELDFENEKLLRSMYPHIYGKPSSGILQIEVESINECTRSARHGQPAEYRYIGTRYVYRVEDEKRFMLLLIDTNLQYKEIYNSYRYADQDY